MWISAARYDELVKEGIAANVKRETAEKELLIARNNEDWLRTQLNTVQLQYSALITQFTGLKHPTPEISRADKSVEEQIEMAKGGALPSLEDPGDEIARKLGIRHADDGSIIYDAA